MPTVGSRFKCHSCGGIASATLYVVTRRVKGFADSRTQLVNPQTKEGIVFENMYERGYCTQCGRIYEPDEVKRIDKEGLMEGWSQ